MRIFLACMLIAVASAAVISNNEFRQPIDVSENTTDTEKSQETAVAGNDGYQYKAVRRLKYRNRRDVSESALDDLPPLTDNAAPEYLPPAEETATEAAEEADAPQDSAVLGDDGYQYKTVRRLKYRHRRDVSEIAPELLPTATDNTAPAYLPPVEETVTEAVEEADAPQDSAVLSEDGYQYKTVRRLKYRHRRDVSEITPELLPTATDNTAPAYLPLVEETVTEAVEVADAPQDSAVLSEDGYQYKTVRRLKYRHRRDVSEITPELLPTASDNTAPEYLPPVENTVTEAVEEADAPQDSVVLGDDGYQYKTVRRLKYRHRRDVSEIAPKYLPPGKIIVSEISEEVEAPQDSAVLGDDGYHYKQPAEAINIVPVAEYLSSRDMSFIVEGPQESAVLGKNGYIYRTIKRIRY